MVIIIIIIIRGVKCQRITTTEAGRRTTRRKENLVCSFPYVVTVNPIELVKRPREVCNESLVVVVVIGPGCHVRRRKRLTARLVVSHWFEEGGSGQISGGREWEWKVCILLKERTR